MSRLLSRFAISMLLLSLCLCAASLCGAQSAQAVQRFARVLVPVDASKMVRLSGHVPEWASAINDQGPLDPNRKLTDLHLILTRAPEVEAAFQQLLANQQNPASPQYHRWLTPAENAAQFGIALTDLQAVEGWMQAVGLSVDDVASGGVLITFSGKVSAVNSAFSVDLHSFTHENAVRYSIVNQPAIPAALSSVIGSIAGLAENTAHSTAHSRGARALSSRKAVVDASPAYTAAAGEYFVAPGDFKVIYDINAATNAGYTGSGYRVAIVGDSRISATDISSFENIFGLQSTVVNQILVPGQADPGLRAGTSSSPGDELEAALDTQRVIGTAAGAGVDLLVINTLSDANIFSALSYELNTLNDAVVNMSFGDCNIGTSAASEAGQYNTYYTALAAQGVSVFVSSGDSGAAGCDDNYTTIPSPQVQAANILCASAYMTCVGGTEFNNTSLSSYWSTTNSSTAVSALSYIPEGGWNEPSIVINGVTNYQALGSGGGPTIVSKPSWQTGPGVPADGYRDTPDLSFLASAENTPYIVCETDLSANCASGYIELVGGTSAAAPSMAAIATLLDQKLGARQGNVNPLLYQLAAATNSPFHDVTVATSGVTTCVVTTPSQCNNSTPTANSLTGGLSGFLVTAGYDEVTGLGSLDVANFLTAAAVTTQSSFTITPASTTLYLNNTSGATTTTSVALASANSFSGAVALTCTVTGTTGSATGSCSLTPASVSLASGGTASSLLTLTNGSVGGVGTLSVTVTGTSGTTVVSSSTVTVNVSAATFTIAPASSAVALSSSSAGSVPDALTLTSINGFAGSVGLSCAVTASGTAAGTCSLSSLSVALTAAGTATSTLTINSSTVGGSGTLMVVVTGTSGTTTVSATVAVTVTPPSFSVTPTASSLSFTSGATSGNSTVLTLGSVNNYVGTIALTCSLSTSSAAYQPTCAISPTSVALTAGSTGSATLTISSTTARSAASSRGTVSLGWSVSGGAILAFLLFCTPLDKRRRALAKISLIGLLALSLGVLNGCSSSSSTTVPTMKSSAGSYVVTVTGTPAAGATTSSVVNTTVNVTIN